MKNLGRPGLQAGKQSLIISLQEHLALRSGSSKSNFFARAVTKHQEWFRLRGHLRTRFLFPRYMCARARKA